MPDTEPQIAGSLIDLIGDTPLLRLNRVTEGLTCTVAAKLEMLNPGGSVKDRPALAMITRAEEEGLLKPGGTIVEPTSGNTGVGLAIVAADRGYRCIFVVTDKVAPEKIRLLEAYGAEVIVCPVAVEPDDPASYYSVSERLVRETPGAFRPNQYDNRWNPWAHEQTTGPELWRQTAGRITHFVAGVGTGGTITGVGRYLKAQNSGVQIVGADPAGSVYSGGSGRPYLVEGIGEDFWPTTYDPGLVDRVVPVSDEDSFLMARRITCEEGLLIGGSGGTAVAAALEVGRELGPDDLVVVLIPDSGRGYLSRVFDDDWMAGYGFLRGGEHTVADILEDRGAAIPPLVYVGPGDSVARAVNVMRAYGLSQLPVAKGEMPLAAAEILGAVDELALMDRGFHDPAVLDEPVEKVMGPRLPTIGVGQPIALAVELLDRAPALVVLAGGRPRAVLSRTDVLRHLSQGTRMSERTEHHGFETRAVRAGQDPDPATGAVVPPISLSTTFAQEGVGRHRGWEYARSANPTRSALETCVAALEGARHGLAFASGLAAEDAILRQLRPGAGVVLGDDAYGGTFRLIDKVYGPAGHPWVAHDLTDPARLERDWPAGTAVVWAETPTNPAMAVVDIAAVAEVAHAHGARLVVDNTFATPYLQQPLALGADVVVHSSTKYLGGHSDVVGGAVALDDDDLAAGLAFTQNAVGAVPSPLDCYLVQRGIKTLAVRMDRHCDNARAIVDVLVDHPAVERVLWPGLPGHPGHDVAKRQMRDFGGMVSFVVRGGEEAALAVAEATSLFTLAESLGAVESLIEHPARMTHASAAGSPLAVDPGLLRLSVGIESAADLVADLRGALDSLG